MKNPFTIPYLEMTVLDSFIVISCMILVAIIGNFLYEKIRK